MICHGVGIFCAYDDFTLSDEKIGGYYIGTRVVLTKIFGNKYIYASVTAADKTSQTRRLFLSTITPASIHITCAWHEKAPLSQTHAEWMQYIPLFMYGFRWNIEVSYYEQKTFWSLCSYMTRSRKSIETMINLINISYSAMKILPYKDEAFSKYKNAGTQEVRFEISRRINEQVILAAFVKNAETKIKSNAVIKALKMALSLVGYH